MTAQEQPLLIVFVDKEDGKTSCDIEEQWEETAESKVNHSKVLWGYVHILYATEELATLTV